MLSKFLFSHCMQRGSEGSEEEGEEGEEESDFKGGCKRMRTEAMMPFQRPDPAGAVKQDRLSVVRLLHADTLALLHGLRVSPPPTSIHGMIPVVPALRP